MLNNILNKILNEFKYQIDKFPSKDVDFIINLIKDNRENNIYFTGIGKSYNIASHLADLIKSIGLKSFILDATKSMHGDIGTLKSDDIIFFFSNSGNTVELLPVIEKCNNSNIYTIGICSNINSKFYNLCKKTIILPFREELEYNNISSIPTNSCMVQLLFSNILVIELVKKLDIKLDEYKLNHPAGNIGANLKSIKDCLIEEYPIFILNKNSKISLNNILLKMTELCHGICIFIDNNNKLLGILLDGDIRKLLLTNNNIQYITINDINKNYTYDIDFNKQISLFDRHYKYIPIIDNHKDRKLIGLCKL